MGQRANYVLIEGGKQTIHYNHWRANCITSDLFLGERRFTEFVRDCKLADVLLDEVWMEGMVIIDTDQKALHFWSLEYAVTSVTDIYLTELRKKWKGWSVNLLYNQMYDAEKILNIDYISQQEIFPLTPCTEEEIIDDKVDKWRTATVVVVTTEQTHVIQTGDLGIAGILNFGNDIIDLLLAKEKNELPIESDDAPYECIIIDSVKKEIIIDKSDFGLWEQTQDKWPAYSFKMGDIGYIGALKLAGVPTGNLMMSAEDAQTEFEETIKRSGDFNPFKMAESLLQQDKDITFSADFFDTVSPQKTLIEKLKMFANKIIAKKQ